MTKTHKPVAPAAPVLPASSIDEQDVSGLVKGTEIPGEHGSHRWRRSVNDAIANRRRQEKNEGRPISDPPANKTDYQVKQEFFTDIAESLTALLHRDPLSSIEGVPDDAKKNVEELFLALARHHVRLDNLLKNSLDDMFARRDRDIDPQRITYDDFGNVKPPEVPLDKLLEKWEQAGQSKQVKMTNELAASLLPEAVKTLSDIFMQSKHGLHHQLKDRPVPEAWVAEVKSKLAGANITQAQIDAHGVNIEQTIRNAAGAYLHEAKEEVIKRELGSRAALPADKESIDDLLKSTRSGYDKFTSESPFLEANRSFLIRNVVALLQSRLSSIPIAPAEISSQISPLPRTLKSMFAGGGKYMPWDMPAEGGLATPVLSIIPKTPLADKTALQQALEKEYPGEFKVMDTKDPKHPIVITVAANVSQHQKRPMLSNLAGNFLEAGFGISSAHAKIKAIFDKGGECELRRSKAGMMLSIAPAKSAAEEGLPPEIAAENARAKRQELREALNTEYPGLFQVNRTDNQEFPLGVNTSVPSELSQEPWFLTNLAKQFQAAGLKADVKGLVGSVVNSNSGKPGR